MTREPTPVERVALLLLLVAAAAVASWLAFDAGDDWMPNVATDAFFVAVTITVVERAIRREASRRLRPLAERAQWTLLPEFGSFCECVALDYEYSHAALGVPLPENQLDLLAKWLADRDEEVNLRPVGSDGLPALIRAAGAFGSVLKETRDLYRNAVTVELAAEAVNFEQTVEAARRVFTEATPASPDFRAGVLTAVVEGALRLGRVLAKTMDDESWFTRLPEAGRMTVYGPTWDAWRWGER